MKATNFKKPDFFVVGAAKAGTTSLVNYLRQRGDVFIPDDLKKEPAFFSHKGANLNYSAYKAIFSVASKQHTRIGEASTAYLSDPISPRRIFKYNPKAQIIIILRNPAERAYSLYNWMCQEGYEYANSFEEALRLEEDRINKIIPNWSEPEYYWNYLYYYSGLYTSQVKRYIEIFGDQVLVVKFEDLIANFSQEYSKILAFLGLPFHNTNHEIYNQSRRIISPRVQFILRKVTDSCISNKSLRLTGNRALLLCFIFNHIIKNSFKFISQTQLAINPFSLAAVYCLITAKISYIQKAYSKIENKKDRDVLLSAGLINDSPKKIEKATKNSLLTKYKPDINRLERLLDRNFHDWLK